MGSRPLFAFLLVILLAGCTGVPGGGDPATSVASPNTDAPTSTETPTPDSRTGLAEDGYANAFTFEATPVTIEDVAHDLAPRIAELHDDERRAASAALENGSATVMSLSHADGVPDSPGPLTDGQRLRRDGTYYRVNATVVDRWTGSGYEVDLEGPLRSSFHDDYEAATTESVPVAELSRVERDLFVYGVPAESRREGGVTAAGYYYLPPKNGSLNGSAWLDGDRHYVRDDGDLFRVRIEGTERPPVVRTRVRYELEPVADSADAFARRHIPDQVTNVTATVPPAPARTVLLSAIENGTHHWSGTVSTRPERIDAASEWVGSLNGSTAGRTAYLRYEGTLYRLVVSEVIE